MPADGNILFADFQTTGFLQQIGGSLARPDVKATCVKGKGSLIDFGVTRSDCVDKLKIEAARAA
eukprot:1130501-Pyramimonas_sp.AAC.1